MTLLRDLEKGNFDDRLRNWRDVFEFYLGGAMLAADGSRFKRLPIKGLPFLSERIDALGQMFYGGDLIALPPRTRNRACEGVDIGRYEGPSYCVPLLEAEDELMIWGRCFMGATSSPYHT
jgi:hypothetical protein